MFSHPSNVALSKCPSYDEGQVKQAVVNIGDQLIGDWDSFIPNGAAVLLKPNLLSPADVSRAVTTHPAVVKAVAEVCRDAGAMNIDGPDFARPLSWLMSKCLTTKPCVDKAACQGCGICLKVCPVQSIRLAGAGKTAAINHNDCIRCFCCQELCPEGAITVKDSAGVKMIAALGRFFSK